MSGRWLRRVPKALSGDGQKALAVAEVPVAGLSGEHLLGDDCKFFDLCGGQNVEEQLANIGDMARGRRGERFTAVVGEGDPESPAVALANDPLYQTPAFHSFEVMGESALLPVEIGPEFVGTELFLG